MIEDNYIYLLEAHGYKLKPFETEKLHESSVICDFAFTTQEAADNFISKWKDTLIKEQGFVEQSGVQLVIKTKQLQLLSAGEG